MKQASEQYRKEMQEPWRGQWGLNIYVGLVRERFQSDALIYSSSPLSFLSLGHESDLFNDTVIDFPVATFENNTFKADGSSYFSEIDEVPMSYQGIISEEVSSDDGTIDYSISFVSENGEKGLRGLTLHFDRSYPVSFSIICSNNTGELFRKQYTNDSFIFTTNDVFSDDATKMTLQIEKMNESHVRFRLRYVLFGVGVSFTNTNILSTGGYLKSFMHPCSIELPTQDFNISIDNYNGDYDIDKESSISNLATIGQDVSVQTSYTKEDGTIEYLPSTTLELSNFDVDGSSLQISAVDFLRNENTPVTFDDPSFFTDSTTLYDVGLKLKQYVLNESFDVVIDDSLKTIPMKYNKIQTTVREGFMMIASAGRCIMDLKDKGLYIRRVEFEHADLSAQYYGTAPYCNAKVLENGPITNYASFEPDHQKADGSYLFPTTTLSEFNTGYISDEISNEFGNFSDYPKITLNASEAISPSYINIQLNSTTAKKVTIKTYHQNEERETLNYDSLSSLNIEITHDFESFDKMDVIFLQVYQPFSRLYVSKISFDSNVYDITYDICENQKPKTSFLDVTRNIIVNYSYMTLNEDGTYKSETNSVTIACDSKGYDLEYTNPFITTEEVARETGEWLKQYYAMRIEYSVDFMGDPILEPYDKIRIENKYDTEVLCEIENIQTLFSNGGIRGKITARRMENGMDRTKSKLVS